MNIETNDDGNVTLYETDNGWIRMEYVDGKVTKYEDSTGMIYNCEYDCDGNRTLYESNDKFFIRRGYENGVLVYVESNDGVIMDNRTEDGYNF